jgi:hydroxymethylglutaryl-CoA reductase
LLHAAILGRLRARQLANPRTLLSGSINNGAHYANGIAAMFIACGEDVANVLCGEISPGSAIVADQWVASHDAYGRNRP